MGFMLPSYNIRREISFPIIQFILLKTFSQDLLMYCFPPKALAFYDHSVKSVCFIFLFDYTVVRANPDPFAVHMHSLCRKFLAEFFTCECRYPSTYGTQITPVVRNRLILKDRRRYSNPILNCFLNVRVIQRVLVHVEAHSHWPEWRKFGAQAYT